LLAAGVKNVSVSLESPDPEIHDRMVGMRGAYCKVLAGMAYLQSGGPLAPKLYVRTVLTRFNTEPQLMRMPDLLAGLGVGRLTLTPPYLEHLPPEERKRVAPTLEQEERFRNEYLPQIRAAGTRAGVKILLEGDNGSPPAETRPTAPTGGAEALSFFPRARCYLPFDHCTITHRGEVVACCRMREGPGVIGNIRDGALAVTLRSSAATDLRARLVKGPMPEACAGCLMQAAENKAIDRILQANRPYSSPDCV
jgi:MoaA/NifB/PqqE/SkfB family radical SAM enzyme